MANILNLETATTNCSVSVAVDGRLVAIKEQNTSNYSHSEELHVFIADVLAEASLEVSDLDAVAVSKGPGSYTGLRIGVSAAKGLCFSLDIPLLSIPTLESIAYQVNDETVDFIIPVLDARRMEVYSAVFDKEHQYVRETRAEIIDGNSFKEYLQKGRVLLLGSGAEKCKAIIDDKHLSYDSSIVPSAREMAQLSYRKFVSNDFEDVAYFEPYYLKDFIIQAKKE
ncbi:tRNA (adenosine(37)-N6)-threonylcarbamoyltransferase complex dimerization subunit type 1 TsaB [Flavobacteriaceae bacterium TP-CH-4]|uniref:tRNA (Adenosine(37)-N6)-threonylcarbamoyltransferase complex dimerization subunit type 1 TsaB n=1 Tax=Pelagihabitans pacificus TaxID=2696054 RepID=A0A967AQ82_9FLAO|nr:tRNA (adenosine(37)-N6)-threonylcarbamoyltransferase complex dimerization subunit type 1 TsaB [Pelagihabitans pacificus]NHF58343.1 tRNA (adenosine(37)-N6)-threonylcarbamoyltransferase complex dimerization subunit type 1 TsaB [Pelagihabitans pacificus]